MNATEAKEMTKKSLANLAIKVASDILKRIEEAANEGRYIVRIDIQALDNTLIDKIVKFYKQQGYSVYHSKSTSNLIISWNNPKDSKA